MRTLGLFPTSFCPGKSHLCIWAPFEDKGQCLRGVWAKVCKLVPREERSLIIRLYCFGIPAFPLGWLSLRHCGTYQMLFYYRPHLWHVPQFEDPDHLKWNQKQTVRPRKHKIALRTIWFSSTIVHRDGAKIGYIIGRIKWSEVLPTEGKVSFSYLELAVSIDPIFLIMVQYSILLYIGRHRLKLLSSLNLPWTLLLGTVPMHWGLRRLHSCVYTLS
jgi:hypothetical protein